MPQFTEEQVVEMVQEEVAKTEKSFGGTFKRLKSENEELKALNDTAVEEYESTKKEMQLRMEELESLLSERTKQISEFAVRGEFQRQLREKGYVPERFVDLGSIEYSDDTEKLRANVSNALEKGRKEFEQTLGEYGITLPHSGQPPVNPTNPPSRDTKTAQDMKRTSSKEVLQDMMNRGLIR